MLGGVATNMATKPAHVEATGVGRMVGRACACITHRVFEPCARVCAAVVGPARKDFMFKDVYVVLLGAAPRHKKH